ncbi:MAG: thiamine-phosphate kinase [Actinomycetota bacterium]
MELSEDELVEAVARVLSGDAPGVVQGIGDDAALVAPGIGQGVLTTDVLVEDVHFEVGSISAHDLGAKAIVVNVSDIASMAASPRYALVGLVLGPDVDHAWVVELYGGIREACDEYALSLVGGDMNRGATTTIAVTVIGEVAPGRALLRSGAAPGERLVVTGALGAAAGGLALSRASRDVVTAALRDGWGRALLDAFVRPVARVGEAQVLAAAGATAMMDLSDGLAKDLPRLCARSGVGAEVDLRALPIPAAIRDGAAALGVEPLDLALGGGEDYELLAAMPADGVEGARAKLRDAFGVALTDIGAIVEGSRVLGVRDGDAAPLSEGGWDHFA